MNWTSKEIEDSRKPIKNNKNQLSKTKEEDNQEPTSSVSWDSKKNQKFMKTY